MKTALPLPLLATCALSAATLANFQAHAQNAEAPPGLITNIAQLRAIGSSTRAQGLPVQVRGVVTYVHSQRNHFFLQDETAGVQVPVSNTNLCPAFAMDVEVRGFTGQNESQWGIMQGEFIVHGPGNPPKPIRATLADAQATRYSGQWVEVEGIILQARRFRSPAVVLQLADVSGISSVGLPSFPPDLTETNIIGSRVRVQGLNIRAGQAQILTLDPKLVSVLTPGHANPFSAPAAKVASLRATAPTLDRVTLRGTVLRTIYKPSPQNGIYIRDDTGAFQAIVLSSQATTSANKVHPGDEVEVVGSPTAIKPNVYLQHCQLRVLRNGPEPEPTAVTPADINAGKFISDLVTVRGRLLYRHEISNGSLWRDMLRLSADGREVDVFVDSNGSGKFGSLSVNDLIEARGVAVPDDAAAFGLSANKYFVQVASVADVRSLGLAPEIARRRTFQLVGTAAVLVLLAGSWIALLRSRLARERRVALERERSEAAILEANASLERRVAERTSELEKARQETARALETERELNALKTRFVSIVSHEFRTPLGIIMSAVELLRNYQERLPAPKRDELHADIYGSTRRMAGLMEQVLVLGRVEGEKHPFKPAPIELAVLCEKLTDESLSATGRRCAIQVQIDGGLEGAQGDEALMRHLFSNLLSNGVKYSPAGSTVEFSARRDGENAVFVVRDRGIGIPEADLPHLFEPFRRASNVGETPGTGLGMLIVKRCVELQNGKIGIESRPGEGTTVTVTLPLFAATPALTH